MSDEQDKSYIEELSDMWNENGWLLDALGGKDMVQQEDNIFNYFEEVAKSMQPNTSQPAAMVASSVANSNIQYNIERIMVVCVNLLVEPWENILEKSFKQNLVVKWEEVILSVLHMDHTNLLRVHGLICVGNMV